MKNRKPPYKDVMNRYRTQSLFWEYNADRKEFEPLWTCKDEDHKSGKYPSLKHLYIAMNDPTEYSFAMKYFGSYEHWKVLCSREWFKPIVEAWRDELELKMKSEALVTIREISDDKDDSRALQAARYLADKGWLDKATKGRPTKESVQGETKRLAHKASELDEDATRIGISIGQKH